MDLALLKGQESGSSELPPEPFSVYWEVNLSAGARTYGTLACQHASLSWHISIYFPGYLGNTLRLTHSGWGWGSTSIVMVLEIKTGRRKKA